MPRRLIQLLILLCLLAPKPGYPLDASRHRQIVVSVTGSWSDYRADLYLFERAGEGWRRVGKAVPAVVGRAGLAWDPAVPDRDPAEPVKHEGDGKAPAGMFPLPSAMGFSATPPAGITLPYRWIGEGTQCVDDRASRFYNRIVTPTDPPGTAGEVWHSSERMWQVDLYRRLLVVGYNAEPPRPGDGSCIFIHIWRSETEPTSGCTALAESELAPLMAWLNPAADPALVQLPRDVYRRVWREWRLPSPELLDEKGKRDTPLVDVRTVAPEVAVEMRYARSDNFTGQAIYDCGRCFLRLQTAEKLGRAERELRARGLSLKMWDCYRPLSVQKLFWALVPDSRFVADPRKGSRHNRGTAVDVTLVDSEGRELAMPTPFDDFSPRAGHDETHLPAQVLANRRLLAETMERAGFRRLSTEWWHYDDADAEGEVMDVPFGELCR